MNATISLMTDEQCAAACRDASGDGFGTLETAAGRLPLVAMDVAARISGLFAETTVRQTFANTHDSPLEATYVFPLPDRAAVTRFQLSVAGRVVQGILMERGAARETYDRAMIAGHRAAMAEEDRPGVFTIRVGNLPPRESATVELDMTGPLPVADGEATFRFPLVVAPRYIPGAPLPGPAAGDGTATDTDAVPDASRIAPPVLLPGFPSPVRLSLSADIDPAGLPFTSVVSSLHAVVEDDPTAELPRRVRIRPGERANRDFILRIRIAPTAAVAAAVACASPGSDGGILALTIVPPATTAAVRPRDIAFVLDRSGSMGGWKIVAARRAIARMVDTLADADRFSLLIFDNELDYCSREGQAGLESATDRRRFRAIERLGAVAARGGTEMSPALSAALGALGERDPARERVLVLVTDGQVGNEDQLLRQVRDQARGVRIFAVGIDQAVNAAFLRRLATPSGGVCELVENEDRLDSVMVRLHRRIGAPVLTDVQLEPDGFSVVPGSLTPAGARDVFEGIPLVLLCRYAGAAGEALEVSGKLADGSEYRLKVPVATSGTTAVGKAWARSLIRDLEDRYAAAGDGDRALADRIARTSLEYGVLSRFTAFVAVDAAERANPGGRQHRVLQPVEPPRGWAGAAALGSGIATFAACVSPSLAAPSGASAKARRAAAPSEKSGCFDLCDSSSDEYDASDSSLGGLDASDDTSLLSKAANVMEDLASVFGRPKRPGHRPDDRSRRPSLPRELAQLLRSAAEALDRLERLVDDAEIRAELAYLMGDLELLLEALKRTSGLGAVTTALQELLKRLRALRDSERSALLDTIAFARSCFASLLGESEPAPASSPPSRREFWK